MISKICNEVFLQSVKDYHILNDVDAIMKNPFDQSDLQHLFYWKNYIDTVQWHLEDIVRDPQIDPVKGLELKRRIDRSNQERTDLVEKIDDYFLNLYATVQLLPSATINSESPAWAIDRLSILILKIFHMQEEVNRQEASDAHRNKCSVKLEVLQMQQLDLSYSIDELISDISSGRKEMKVYRQMKMYNDPSLNPILYNLKGK
jgi:hypothetical protein